MKKLYSLFVKTVFTLTRPLSAIVLHNSRRVRTVVVSEDTVLLVRSSFGHQLWSFPGGGIEKNEDPVKAALRELYDETALKTDESQIKCIGEDRIPSGKRYPMIAMVFYAVQLPQKQSTRVIRPLEILEVKWFKLDKLPKNRSKSVDIGLKMLENHTTKS